MHSLSIIVLFAGEFMNKKNPFERFLNKYAIRNLSLIVIMCYGFGYILQYVNADFLDYLTLNPYAICHGQVWRLITWVLVPPDTSNIFFILIAMLFYYSIGTALERTWGTVEYNRYMWEGILITIAGAFVVMLVSYLIYGGQLNAQTAPSYFTAVARYFSTYYVNMSIFLAYAATFPDAVVLFMFFIPMKVKWLGIIYGIILVYDFVVRAMSGNWIACVAMAASLANFLLYWLRTRSLRRYSPGEIKRRRDFRRKVSQGERERWNRRGNNRMGSSGTSGGRYSGNNSSGTNGNQTGSPFTGQNTGGHYSGQGSSGQSPSGNPDQDGWIHTNSGRDQNRSGTGTDSNSSTGAGSGTGWHSAGSSAAAGTFSGSAAGGPAHMRPDTSKAHHRCCICGRTEIDHPELEFRYCSKCQGNFEFCQDHLFRHVHAANGQPPRLIQQDETDHKS